MSRRAETPPPLSLYVHLPWCLSKCPYCDFNSHALTAPLDERGYIRALIADLDADLAAGADCVQGRSLCSVFIGGGTPNLFSAASIAALLREVRARIPFTPSCEITLEANPGAGHGNLRGFRDAGVNRLSLGAQSFDDAMLVRLGRAHSAADIVQTVAAARRAGFDNLNLDLMFGLPGQTPQQGLADVRRALALAPEHLSWYQLTIEPNTLFHARPPALPDDDSVWRLQRAATALLHKRGYRRYEVSAYTMKKRCRHNLNVWRFGDYLGIGAGAHGKWTRAGKVVRTRKHRNPSRYIERAHAGRCCVETRAVAGGDLLFEFLLNALRLTHGFRASLFHRRTGLDAGLLERRLAPLTRRGLIERRGAPGRRRYAATPLGARFLDDVLVEILPESQPFDSATTSSYAQSAGAAPRAVALAPVKLPAPRETTKNNRHINNLHKTPLARAVSPIPLKDKQFVPGK
ncbi:MAG: radical SAM family heme chaperone HemW [Gammaproteobacteria bacterium]|nr:radical SAM family heme chaperone HemW [Gammaproteobacteria bacterium]